MVTANPAMWVVTASDNKDLEVDIICNPPSGTNIQSGQTTVTCMATDDAGNTAPCTFLVTLGNVNPYTLLM